LPSTGAEDAARELLDCALSGRAWREETLARVAEGEGSQWLFRIVAEGLADRFEPRLCDVYAEMFSEVLARHTGLDAQHLLERYRRVRKVRKYEGDAPGVRDVFVLSRVTLGADIAVTSVLLDAARRKFPAARIWFAGSRKSWELFAGAGWVHHAELEYGRSAEIESRLKVWPRLRELCAVDRSVVIDPDSRLTQLGLLPVCAEPEYYFFESRGYGGEGTDTLGALASRWAEEVFGVAGARAWLQPSEAAPAGRGEIAVSLGVGENPAKRMSDAFERDLLRLLAETGRRVVVDEGASLEEAARARRAAGAAGVETWRGPFAEFAERIRRSSLYAGYDSAGGHAAASFGVPLVSIFLGYPCERMFERWKPGGPGPKTIVRGEPRDEKRVWRETCEAVQAMASQ
jgi:ADP-heptose:LPS heptosyltransferase